MPTYDQLPGTLNFSLVRGDSFSMLVDFSISLVGHSLEAELRSAVSGQLVDAITCQVVSESAGTVNVSLSAEQTAELAAGTYAWELRWTQGTAVRTALTGYVEAI